METFERGREAGHQHGLAGTAYAPAEEGMEYNSGYSAGYAAGRDQFAREQAAQEAAERTAEYANHRALAPMRGELNQLGRILFGDEWPRRRDEFTERSESDQSRLTHSFRYAPEKHVSKRRLPAVERELYGTDDPARAFVVKFLDLILETILEPAHIDAFVRAATRKQTGVEREDWNRCTVSDLNAICANLRMDPGSYAEWRWVRKDYRRRAPALYAQTALA